MITHACAHSEKNYDELWPLCETLVAEAAARALRKTLEGDDEEPRR